MTSTAIVLAPERWEVVRTCLSGGATIMTTTQAAHIDFTTGEGLRILLTRIHGAGKAAWRSDRDVPALMDYTATDRKSTRLNSSHVAISYAVFCVNKKS